MFRLRVLGSLDLRREDGVEVRSLVAQPKRIALLLYLALARPGAFHRRDTLLSLFWPEASQARGRASLRQALHFLRRSLGAEDVVETRGEDEVGLCTGACWCDAVAFGEAIESGNVGEALELYRGDLLEGFFVTDSPAFERWLEGERARLREIAAGAAWTRAHELIEAQELVEADRTAQRAVALSCTEESQVRAFVEALAGAGDRAAALAFYQRFSKVLADALGVEPAPETQAVVQRILSTASHSGEETGTTAPGGSEPTVSDRPPATTGRRSRPAARVWPWVGGAMLGAAALGVALTPWIRPSGEEPGEVARYNLAFLPGQELLDVAAPAFDVASRGAALVYVGRGETVRRLWVKHRGQVEAIPIPGSVCAAAPALSPDAREVVFLCPGQAQLLKAPLAGGPAVVVADSVGLGPTAWLEDGTLVYSSLQYRLRRSRASGGPSWDVWTAHPEGVGAFAPSALPGSKGVLFTVCDSNCTNVMEVWALDLRSDEAHRLVTGALRAWYVRSGYVVFARPDGTVWAAPFDLETLELSGSPVSVLDGVEVRDIHPHMAVAADGTLLMRSGPAGLPAAQEMVWVDRGGGVRQVDPGWRFTRARNTGWALSPDGTRLAVALKSDEGDDIFIKELDEGPLLRLTFHPEEESRPRWSPDGDSVYFISRRLDNRNPNLFVRKADGSGDVSPVLLRQARIWETEATPDGEWVVARVGGLPGLSGGRDLLAYELRGDTVPVPVVVSEYDAVSPQLSPDGRWLAYASNETGQWEVYVRPFPAVGIGKWVVSREGGSQPMWAHSGKELFYVSAGGEMTAVSVEAGETFEVTRREVLFRIPPDFQWSIVTTPYDIAPDDQRFIFMRDVAPSSDAPPRPLILVENWLTEVQARLGENGG